MDEADLSDARITIALEDAIRRKKPTGPEPTGWCLYCREPLEEGLRWCDAECEREWEYEQARMRANGRNY